MKIPFLLVLFCVSSATARDWQVDGAVGNDAGDGSPGKPLQSIAKALEAAAAGDRILLAPGIYRETVDVRKSGNPGTPIVLESADPARPAVLSGADAITGWKPLKGSGLPAASHPHAETIQYADLDWTPGFLFAGSRKQSPAREPNSGWFPAVTTDGKTITSDKLGAVDTASLRGAKIFFFRAKGVEQQFAEVQEWTEGSRTSLDLTEPLFKGRNVPYTEGDRLYLSNHVAFLDQPGEWVTEATDTGCRLYWWPPDPAALAEAEAPRRDTILDLSGAAYFQVGHLHIRHAAPSAAGFGLGFGTGNPREGLRTGITISQCAVYQNMRFGIAVRGGRDITVKNCLVVDNSYGVTVSGSRHVLVENCEIAWNLNDGLIIAWDIEEAIVRGNVVHHHSRFAHPDNFQTYRGVKNILLDSNVMVAAGQGAHTQQTVDLTARNNIFAGTSANLFFTSGPDAKNTGTEKEGGGYVLENNTFSLFANGAVLIKGPGHRMENNIFDVRGGKYAYGADVGPEAVQSKNNRFWITDSSHRLIASFAGGKRFTDLKELQEQTGLEQESVFGDPQFARVPVRVVSLDGKRIAECTPSTLVYEGSDAFQPGDHVEFDFDGVDRVVRSVGPSTLEIDPPLASAPVTTVLIARWGDKPVAPIDLTTPDKRGSTVDFEAWMRADFNRDGRRDVPPWPEGIPHPRRSP